jgi:membrane protein DedA with SNARE-associated domain
MKNFWAYIGVIRNQLIIIGFVIVFKFAVYIGLIPDEAYFLNVISSLFIEYGIIAVIIASFIENIIGVGTYFPGSIVILTSMALTGGNIHLAVLTFLAIVLPSTIAHIMNYLIGRKISKYTEIKGKKLFWFLFTTLWHPHFAAVSTFTLGSQKLNFRKFLYYFIPIHLFWNIFWGVMMFKLGETGREDFSIFNLFYGYLVCWIIYDLVLFYKQRNSKSKL